MNLLETLEKGAQQQKIASSYIFVGTELESLKLQAVLFAKRLNCLNQTIDTCTACKKIENRTHPDCHWIEANGELIKIETLRDLQRRLYLKPYEGSYKVIIILGAEMLQPAGGNSLLKILEEPPAKTVFILTTPDCDRLLPTIVSRSHIIRMNQSKSVILSHELLPLLLNLPSSQIERFELAQKMSEDDEIFKNCLEILGAWTHALLLSKQGLSLARSPFAEKADLAQTLAQKHSTEKLLRQYDIVLKTQQNLKFQTHREIMAENLLLELS